MLYPYIGKYSFNNSYILNKVALTNKRHAYTQELYIGLNNKSRWLTDLCLSSLTLALVVHLGLEVHSGIFTENIRSVSADVNILTKLHQKTKVF